MSRFMALGGYISAILTIAPAKKAVLLDLPPFLEALQLAWPAGAGRSPSRRPA